MPTTDNVRRKKFLCLFLQLLNHPTFGEMNASNTDCLFPDLTRSKHHFKECKVHFCALRQNKLLL